MLFWRAFTRIIRESSEVDICVRSKISGKIHKPRKQISSHERVSTEIHTNSGIITAPNNILTIQQPSPPEISPKAQSSIRYEFYRNRQNLDQSKLFLRISAELSPKIDIILKFLYNSTQFRFLLAAENFLQLSGYQKAHSRENVTEVKKRH